jgi:hypothetical protein
MGEEFVVIVTPADHMCKRCTSLLTHMDKLENDLKLVKNAMISYIQKKYGILPADQPIKTLDVVNGHLKTDELEIGQKKVPSGLTFRDTSVNPPMKMLKTQHPQESSSKMKIYKCGFCTFQSKELGHVRFHMRSHMNKKGDGEKANQTAAKTIPIPPQQKKRLYRCQVCSASFDSRISCLEHIQKDHNQSISSTTNEEKEADVPTKEFKQEIIKTENDTQNAESPLDLDENQQEKSTVDTDMLLNDHVPAAEEPADAGASADVTNTEEPEQEIAGEEAADGQDEALLDQEEAEQAETIPNEEVEQDNAEKGDGQETEIEGDEGEDKSGASLDIESMLAAIHNDNATAPEEDTAQNVD